MASTCMAPLRAFRSHYVTTTTPSVVRPKPSSTIGHRALLALVGLGLAACSSTTASHRIFGPTIPPAASYDVLAAKLCATFDTFVSDAKANKASISDSQALDAAEKAVKAHPGPRSKWKPLADKVATFLTDAGKADANAINQGGLRIGATCVAIPFAARQAGGFTQ